MSAVTGIWQRFTRTQVWRAWQRYGDRRGNRLAGATTFFGFLSLFPLIVLAAAVTAAFLPGSAVESLKDTLKENLPGIGDKIDIDSLVANAGTIGWISGASLLLTGLGWIDSLRASIRSMHELDDQPGNMVKLKLADLGALVGLGVIGLVSAASSSVVSGLSKEIVDRLGLEGTWFASWGLKGLAVTLAVLTGALLFLYLQTGMPRIILPRKVALIAALAGGIVFFGAQKLGNVYVNNVIGKNEAYGALALPLALLVWIYLMTRIIMLIAAWAKEATLDHASRTGQAEEAARTTLPFGTSAEPGAGSHPDGAAGPGPGRRPGGPAGPVPVGGIAVGGAPAGPVRKVVVVPSKRADTVAVAAGALLGVTVTAVAVTVGRAGRGVVSGLRRR